MKFTIPTTTTTPRGVIIGRPDGARVDCEHATPDEQRGALRALAEHLGVETDLPSECETKRVGLYYSELDDRFFAGMTDGTRFTGKKHDVTLHFIMCAIRWIGADNERVTSTPDGGGWRFKCERWKGNGRNE